MGAWLRVLAALGRAANYVRLDRTDDGRSFDVEVWQNARGEWYVDLAVRVLCNEHDDPCVITA